MIDHQERNKFHMEIDLVYSYVNANDSEWVQQRNQYSKSEAQTDCRFRDNNELLYSLRSVEKYASWVRKIFILTDTIVPEWLNIDNEKIVIVRHEDVLSSDLRPCYNSSVFEHFLVDIDGLSEHFIYLNDDCFFGNYVDESFFFEDGKPIVRMIKYAVKPNTYFDRILYNAKEVFEEKYHKKYDLITTHSIDAYSKSSLMKCREVFYSDLEPMFHNRFRADNDIQRIIYHYYMIANDECILKVYKEAKFYKYLNFVRKMINPSHYLDFYACNLDKLSKSKAAQMLIARNPKSVCLNDSEATTDNHIQYYRHLMEKKFPDKSSFEK